MTPSSRWNTLFCSVEAMRALFPRLTLRQAIAFLYICENEGLNIQELAFVSRLSKQTASRAARAMAEPDDEHQAPALLRLEKHPSDGRLVRIFLDDGGRSLRDKINAAIAERQLIASDVADHREAMRA